MDRLSARLELAAHVALMIGAVTVAWIYWYAENPEPRDFAPIVRVDSSTVLSSWRPSERRIFLFVSPTCPFCNRSMEFYAHLGRVVDSLQQAGDSVALAAVIDKADSPQTQRQKLLDYNVKVDTLLTLSSRSFRPVGLTSVPTVVVESPGTSNAHAWVGLQDSTGEREILSTVRPLESSP